MSIRKKVVISNLLTFLLPVVIGILSLYIASNAVEERFVYEDHFEIIQRIEQNILEEDFEKVIENVKEIEAGGYSVKLILDNDTSYESENYNEYSDKVIGEYFNNVNKSEYTIINESGEASCIKLFGNDSSSNDNINYLYMVSTQTRVTLEEQNETIAKDKQFIMKIILFVLVAIVSAVILTTSVMTFIILRSILRPLNVLREGTNQIKEGNLHFEIDYPNDDEFGDVCKDFDDMREKLLNSKEEKERYENNRKELIAGITHDLNTPLTSIKGFTSGLLEGIIDTKEKQIRYLENINQTADQMSKMINELFLYSTLDMNGVSFNFISTDLVDFFEGCISEISSEFSKNNIYIHFITELEMAEVQIDWMHFKRVVLNIIKNSAKYKKDGIGNIYITLSEYGELYNISFADDGMGITKDEITNIFDPFYRADKSRNQQTGGAGLGLAIVKNIVNAHNGSIRVNEKYNDGLELIISLPKAGLKVMEEGN
ncbi:hypothetical protein CIW83_10905 [Tissierella sp. P1]|jgi:signal transduction histidine kinase|uniref:sensor histidine kinase n=1 Tax=Tissierella sp. P1 TaxID=1280483 RepID=UPI000B9FCB9F|nr:HAMP domain-containing sensor histidine kinase [Tissierella sp. P1]OZV12126.1 hypothetical protein CIW83_10905 [Tissierella sp. P1]